MPNKMERFTQRARQVLTLAQQAAEQLQHSHIGTEHLLLGLLRESGGVAGHALRAMGLQEQTAEALARELSRAGSLSAGSQLDLSDGTKKVLELAVDEARRMGHHYIGTEHLLLGVTRQSDSVAAEILRRQNIEADALRQQIRRVMQQPPPEPATAPPAREQTTFPTPEQLRERCLSIIENTVKIYGHVLSTITQEQAQTWRDQNDAPNGWTALEVLGHVADYDQIFYERALMMLEQEYPQLPHYDHNALAVERAYNQQDKAEVYARLVESRRRFVELFRSLSIEQWGRAGVHAERGHFTLWDALMQVATHDTRHLEQLTRIIAEATP